MLYHPIPRRVYLWRRLLAALTLSLVLASLAAQVAQAQASVRYVNSAIDDGLVASWSFDASEGGEFRDIAHLPKRGNFGTLSGSAVLDNSDKPDIGGLNPAALALDGGDGMGLVADTTGQLNLANAFTLVGWVKRTVDDGPGVLYSSGTSAGAWYIGFGQDGRLILGADAQILASSTNRASDRPVGSCLCRQGSGRQRPFLLWRRGSRTGPNRRSAAAERQQIDWRTTRRRCGSLARTCRRIEHLQPRFDRCRNCTADFRRRLCHRRPVVGHGIPRRHLCPGTRTGQQRNLDCTRHLCSRHSERQRIPDAQCRRSLRRVCRHRNEPQPAPCLCAANQPQRRIRPSIRYSPAT